MAKPFYKGRLQKPESCTLSGGVGGVPINSITIFPTKFSTKALTGAKRNLRIREEKKN